MQTTVLAQDVRASDVIHEGSKRIVVSSVDKGCTRQKVHVNNQLCWDRIAELDITRTIR